MFSEDAVAESGTCTKDLLIIAHDQYDYNEVTNCFAELRLSFPCRITLTCLIISAHIADARLARDSVGQFISVSEPVSDSIWYSAPAETR